LNPSKEFLYIGPSSLSLDPRVARGRVEFGKASKPQDAPARAKGFYGQGASKQIRAALYTVRAAGAAWMLGLPKVRLKI